jgi:signal transduction histidine kinase
VKLPSIVKAALDAVRPQAAEKHIRLDTLISEVEPVTGDAPPLQQMVSNLLSNAMKFTPATSYVRVLLDYAGEQTELTVETDGPGINPVFWPHIFAYRHGSC